MRIVAIGDIHTQAEKLWTMLREAELLTEDYQATDALKDGSTQLVLLGDLVHAKSREQYARLTQLPRYDEFNPKHIAKAEAAQAAFLHEVKAFAESAAPNVTILMGNHDYNAVNLRQGPLRTDDVAHLEWKDKGLEPELKQWLESWPYEHVIEGIHFAHVGPLKEHNRYDEGFYLENRRRWIYEDKDFLAETPYRLGVYGHTPVRGGVNIASQGKAILLDTNGNADEYTFLEILIEKKSYRLRWRGLFFDERLQR